CSAWDSSLTTHLC
nr:immunoglobulin light chain junction region [Macaca mulatta]